MVDRLFDVSEYDSKYDPDDETLAFGEYPPLTESEMIQIADYLDTMRTPDNSRRIDVAMLWWVDKAQRASEFEVQDDIM